MASGPEPTPPDHGWGCAACPWRGRTLPDAKRHVQDPPASPWDHLPYEAPLVTLEDPKKQGLSAKGATRVMYQDPEDPQFVRVVTWVTVQRRFSVMAKPLVERAMAKRRH